MLSLAARNRPRTFNDVAGQEIVKKILQNGLKTGKLNQICLFYGASGIGKTTFSRLVALSLVCEQKTAEMQACLKCENCIAAINENHPDIFEIDAATYTGIDDMKSFLENITYAPRMSKNRIYIVDEMHMLSKSAISALLKTIEEPPAHAWFFFATTEKDKIPETIFSRCLPLQLHHLTQKALIGFLEQICIRENITAQKQALAILAEYSLGNIRLALTLLEQANMLAGTEVIITLEHMMQLCDIAHDEELLSLYKHIQEHNIEQIFAISEALCSNHNPISIALQLLKLAQKNNDVFLGVQISQFLEMLYKNPYPHKILGMLLAKAAYLHTLPSPDSLWAAIKQINENITQTEKISNVIKQQNIITEESAIDIAQSKNIIKASMLEELEDNNIKLEKHSHNKDLSSKPITNENHIDIDLYQEALAIFGK